MIKLEIWKKTFILFCLLYSSSLCFANLFEKKPNIATVAIIGTNDLHGTAFPKQLIRLGNKDHYKFGGLVYMARMMDIIKEEFGPRTIYLDAGDQYQGGVQAGPFVSKGQIILDFFDMLDLKASAIGNHQFDYGSQFLLNYLNARKSPSLAANLFSQKNQKQFLPKQKSSDIFELDGIKLGVIGLSTTETPTTTSGFVSKKFPKYNFLNYTQIVIQQSAKLRQKGAQIIILIAHFGNKCPKNKTYDIRTNETHQAQCQHDQIVQLIDQLPQNTINGVLCGHRHQFVHHWHKNVPFMGTIDGGSYFNVLYLHFDLIERTVVGSVIEGPIPVCQKIFTNTKTCDFYGQQQIKDVGPLINWDFHDKLVYAHHQLNKIYESKYMPRMVSFMRKICDNQIVLQSDDDQQNSLANLISTLLIKAVQDKGSTADFSILNYGTFRSTWFPGTIQDQHFFSMFPFQNRLSTFQITGSQLLDLLNTIQKGWFGFYFADGLFQTLSITHAVDPEDQTQIIKQKGFVNVTLLNGTQIDNSTTYTGIIPSFLLEGGDDFIKIFGIGASNRIQVSNVRDMGGFRDEVYVQLRKLGRIRAEDWKIGGERAKMRTRIITM